MKACILLFILVSAASGHLLRQQTFPQNLVFEPLDNLGFQNFFRSFDSQELPNDDDMLSDSAEWTAPFFTKMIQHESPLYGDSTFRKRIQITAAPNSLMNNKKNTAKVFNDAEKALQHFTNEQKESFHEAFKNNTQNYPEDAHLNATQLLNKHHHTFEEHFVTTDDGYILTMFRMFPQQSSFKQAPVVFLLHGLLGSADDWLLMNKSLAYMLSDAGFEVWLGNARGSRYSQRHVSKHPAQSDFWQFSIDEIAHHDLPAMIDHVLQVSGQEKLFFVGHSLGNTAFFALASSSFEFGNKIAMMFALSPMVSMENTLSPFIRMMSQNSPFFNDLQQQLGDGELKPSKELVRAIGGNMCQKRIGCEHICGNLNFVVTGMDPSNMEVGLVPVIVSHVPSGASTRQIKQYSQAMAAGELRKYDYGAETNTQVYGNSRPPTYNMSKVQVPVALFYSNDDWMAHWQDVEKLHQDLPDVKDFYRVPEEHFSHMDFQFSQSAPAVINQRIVDFIKNTE